MPRYTTETVTDAIIETYIKTGRAVTAEEIAEVIGCSVSTVRKVIASNCGSVPGTCVENSFDRKIRYQPHTSTLARMLRELRSMPEPEKKPLGFVHHF